MHRNLYHGRCMLSFFFRQIVAHNVSYPLLWHLVIATRSLPLVIRGNYTLVRVARAIVDAQPRAVAE
eukprot:1550271-Lingulodinium_polyedra.AAC.1